MVSFYAGGSGIFPMGWNGGPLPVHGSKVLLDSDSDTYITSDTDDQIQFFAGSSEIAEFDGTSINFANTRFALSGTIASGSVQGFLIDPTMTSTGGGISMFGVGGTHIPAVGQSAYGSAFGTTIVEGGSGTHTDLAGVLVYALDITAAGGATTNASTLKVLGAPTEATNNYALWVADGDVQLDSPLTIGGTHSIGGRQAVRINGTYTTTGGGYSVFNSGGTLIPANGETAYAAVFNTVIEEGSSGTHGDFVGLYIPTLDITADAGGTITNAATFKIGGAPTEATNNYALHVDAGQVKIATTTAATSSTTGALQVAGGIGVAGKSYFGDGLFVQSGGSPGGMGIYQKNTQGIADNTTTVIATSSTAMAGGITGGFGMVVGRKSDNSENQFHDLILIPRVSGSTIVKAASTSDGSVPTTRTYTMSAERQISLNHTDGTTGTYDVEITVFGVNNPYIA